MYAVKGKLWWAGIGTLTHSRSYNVFINIHKQSSGKSTYLAHAQLLWIVVQTPKFTNYLYNAQCQLAHLCASEQSSITWSMSHNLHNNCARLLFGVVQFCMLMYRGKWEVTKKWNWSGSSEDYDSCFMLYCSVHLHASACVGIEHCTSGW